MTNSTNISPVCRFYFKPGREIVPNLDPELNKQATLKLKSILRDQFEKIPKMYLENWERVGLYHPSGDVEKAHAIIIEEQLGAYDLNNRLNDLTGKEWTKFTCSWFIFNALKSDLAEEKSITPDTALHPATYSPTMIESFIRFFTKEGDRVFDPFLGIGSTAVAAKRTGRIGSGIELNAQYYEICLLRTPEFRNEIFHASSERISTLPIKGFAFSISSPPYWDVLNRSTKDFERKRSTSGLHTNYSNLEEDIGNEANYEIFLDRTVNIYRGVLEKLKPGGHMVIIVKNVKKAGVLYPIAWDLGREIGRHAILKDEKIWIQDKVGLAPYGYPSAWASNILHHYCLIFQKPE